jgi:excisionase family DNA binding protein
MLRAKQVAERLQLSLSKVYALVETGKLGHHRMDGAIRFSEEQVAEYLDATKRERLGERPFEPTRSRSPLKHVRVS